MRLERVEHFLNLLFRGSDPAICLLCRVVVGDGGGRSNERKREVDIQINSEVEIELMGRERVRSSMMRVEMKGIA